jgi:hypothetical protein
MFVFRPSPKETPMRIPIYFLNEDRKIAARGHRLIRLPFERRTLCQNKRQSPALRLNRSFANP